MEPPRRDGKPGVATRIARRIAPPGACRSTAREPAAGAAFRALLQLTPAAAAQIPHVLGPAP